MGFEPGRGPVGRLMERLARLILRRRWLVAAITAVVTSGAVYLALGVRFDFTVQELFAADDPEIEYLEQFKREFGPDDDVLLVLVEARDVFAPRVLRLPRPAVRWPRSSPGRR